MLPRAAIVPDVTTAGQDTVALRVPAHPVALALLRACQRPRRRCLALALRHQLHPGPRGVVPVTQPG